MLFPFSLLIMYVFARGFNETDFKVERLPPLPMPSNLSYSLDELRYAADECVMPWDCKGVIIAMPEHEGNLFDDMDRRQKIFDILTKAGYNPRIVDAETYDHVRIIYRFDHSHIVNSRVVGAFVTDDYVVVATLQKEIAGYSCVNTTKICAFNWKQIAELIGKHKEKFSPAEIIVVEDRARLSAPLMLLLNQAGIKYSYHEFNNDSRSCHLLRWAIEIFSEGPTENRLPQVVGNVNFSWNINGQTVNRIRSNDVSLPYTNVTEVFVYRCKAVKLMCVIPFTSQSKLLRSIAVPYMKNIRSKFFAMEINTSRIVTVEELGDDNADDLSSLHSEYGATCISYGALRNLFIMLTVIGFIGSITAIAYILM